MKHLKKLGLAALAAMALTAFLGAGSASATTLEVEGVTKNESLGLTVTLKPDTRVGWDSTSGVPQNECVQSHAYGSTNSPYTGSTVTGEMGHLTFHTCAWSVTVHKQGTFHVEHTSNTNGTVRSSGTEVTVFSHVYGLYINCKTGTGTHIGTLVGASVANTHATLTVNAVLNCGFFVPSANWKGEYTVTTPTGLGVSA